MTAPKQPVLEPGDVLAGRYRLVQQVSTGAESGAVTTLWQAEDEVLARTVAVRLLPADGPRAADADRFLDAAAEAGAVDLPVFARVFDAALEERAAVRPGADGRVRKAGSVDVAYVIREWVDGHALDDALRADGPLDPDTARALVADAARGLASAASKGVFHGRIHPGNVVLTPDGRLKLVDLGVAAALPGASGGSPSLDSPARDTRELGAVLYALLTARWPTTAVDGPAGALAAAPVRDGQPQRPKQLVKTVPAALDDLVARVVAGSATAPTTPSELARALDRIRPEQERSAREARLSPKARRRLPAALVAGMLLVLGAVSYGVGRQIGAVESEDDAFETLVEPSAPAAAEGTAGAPVDLLGTAQVTDFDPPPGDGRESPGAVPNAYDGDPSTAWETERYSTPELGGLKDGVGLLVDLGSPTALAAVELGLRPGTGVEVRAADEAGVRLEDFPVVATGGGEEVVRLETRQTARFWLVVLTELPADGEGFRGSITEMILLRG